MLERALKNSLIGRVVAWLAKAYALSAIKAFFTRTASLFGMSRAGRAAARLAGAPATGQHSVCYAALTRVNKSLRGLGGKIRPVIDGSVPARARRYRDTHDGICLTLSRELPGNRFFLLLFALYMPLDALLRNIGSLEVVASYWDEGLFLLALLYVIYDLCMARDRVKPRVSPLDAAIILFMALGLLLMSLISPDMGVAVAGYRAVCQYMLWFFIVIRLIRSDSDALAFIIALCAIAFLVSLHGIYQYIVAAPIPDAWVSDTEFGVRTRAFSILGSPNIMGCLMLMTAPLCLSLTYYFKDIRVKLMFLFGAGSMCLACVFTFSRGAWLGLAAGLFIFALLKDRRLLFLMAAAGFIALFVPDIMNRITFLFTSDFEEASAKGGRSSRWAYGIDLLLKSDIAFGYGLGRFGGAVAMQNQTVEGLNYFYMDNYYLKTLVEMGVVGFAGYLLLILSTIWNGLRSLFRTRGTGIFGISAGLLASIAGVLTHCLFENIFEVPYMTSYFWGLAALLMWFGFLRKN